MRALATRHPLLGFLAISVCASVISAWLISPSAGPLALVAGGGLPLVLKMAALLLVLAAGASLTLIGMRLATSPDVLNLVPAGGTYSPGRRLTVQPGKVVGIRTADDAPERSRRHDRVGPGQGRGEPAARKPRDGEEAARTGPPGRHDIAPHGLYRATWRRQDSGRPRLGRGLPLARRPAAWPPSSRPTGNPWWPATSVRPRSRRRRSASLPWMASCSSMRPMPSPKGRVWWISVVRRSTPC